MTGTVITEQMPKRVRTTRTGLWIQVVLNALGTLLTLNAFFDVTILGPGRFVIPVVYLAFAVLPGALAARWASRQKWVRRTALAMEGILVVIQLVTLLLTPSMGPSYGPVVASAMIVGLVVAVAAIVQVSRHETATWFTQ